MQNMNYYYDFSGQKFGYPLSLSINQFNRLAFSRQSSLEISYVLKVVMKLLRKVCQHLLRNMNLF